MVVALVMVSLLFGGVFVPASDLVINHRIFWRKLSLRFFLKLPFPHAAAAEPVRLDRRNCRDMSAP